MTAALAILAGYLVGAIPFGLVLVRAAGLGDIRTIGSGNIGATNVLRTGRTGLALATLILDAGKAAFAYGVGLWLAPGVAIYAGAAALIGHLFPVYLRFKGGKGVATYLGLMLAVNWALGLMICVTWLITALIFRYSSLAAMVAVVLAPFYALMLSTMPVVWTALVLAVIVIQRHHGNIARLITGTETKIGTKRKP
ncbi:MAG: glycerol-3-phosphate 1-O-acyltransferase PlsY [Rhodothalassiaceae bacterium]